MAKTGPCERTFVIGAELHDLHPRRVLDVGCSHGLFASELARDGVDVTTVDVKAKGPDGCWHIKGAFPYSGVEEAQARGPYDLVIASHVMEHIQDTGLFLASIRGCVADGGHFAVLVPHRKDEIVGGHVHLWNMGLLIYNLILGGFDCANGRFIRRGGNLCGIVGKRETPLPALRYDCGDIETLQEAGLWPFEARHGFDGAALHNINWQGR